MDTRLISPFPISVFAVCDDISIAIPAKAMFPAMKMVSKAGTLPWTLIPNASQVKKNKSPDSTKFIPILTVIRAIR